MITDRRRITSHLGLALAALSAFFCLGILPGSAEAQVSALPLNFSDVAIFATNSARIDNSAQVTSGHVVVNDASTSPPLSPGFELRLGNNAHTPTGYAAVGDSISIGNGAVVGGNVFYNTLSNSGTINGTQNTPLALPVFSPLPTFKSAPPGTLDVTVAAGTTQAIAAGNYRDIKVMQNATLRIDQGVTNTRSITVSNGGKLLFLNLSSGVSEVRVSETMNIGNGFVVGPVDSDPLKASKIVFYVASGSMMPVAVDTGNGGTLYANVYAPNGTLVLDNGTTAVGAFLARNVDVQNGSTVALESFFTQAAPAITSANSTTFTVGQAGSFTVTTTGTPTPSITRTGSLPSGVSFVDNGDGTGTLSGTPAAGTGGTYAITFTASNGVPPDAVQNFTLTVNQAPAITSANATTFTVGQAGSFTVTTTGFPAPSIAQGGTLPSGVSFVDNGNGTGTLSGTPAAGTGGVYAITFTASNTAGSANQNFTLTVNQAPAFTSAASTTFTVGQAGSFTITTSGFPTVTTIAQGGALPAGVSYVDNGNGTATLSGTPAAGTGGNYPLTLTASNGVPPNAVQNFTLTVNQAPSITSANSATFNIGVANTFTVTTTGFPTPGIAESGALPAGVGFVDNGNGTGTLSGTPGAGTAGGYPLTFTASNGVSPNALQSFTLTVVCPAVTVNPAGPALPDGTFGVAYSQTFTAAGGTAPHTFVVTAGALPGGLNLAGSGALTGSPTNTGNFSFTVTATDAFGCTGARSYTIFVRPNAQADAYANGVGNTQFAVGASAPATPHVFVSGTVLGNDAGPAPLSAGPASITSTNGGAVALNTDGTFTYTPAVGFAGPSDTFTYTLTDGNGITATAVVTINLADVVWYVDNTYGGGSGASDGRSHRPFTTLSAAEAPSLANQYVFVHQGVGPTLGGIALDTGQTLWGQGATFTLHGLTIAATARPTVTGTITLNTGTTVRALNVSSAALTGVNDPLAAITGVNVSEVSVTTTVGTAVNLSDTGGTLSFTSVSANGGTNGIVLQNTTGSFTVTGASSGNCGGLVVDKNTVPGAPNPADCTGGTIQNTTTGIRLDNAQNVSLTRMRVTGTSASTFGIYGTSVNGFTLSHSLIDGSIGTTTGGQDAPLVLGKSNPAGLNGLSGTSAITDSTIRGGVEHNVEIYNQSGSFALAITRTVIRSNSTTTGSDGILLETQGTATGTVTVDNSYFDDNRSQAFQANALDNSVLGVTVTNSWLTRTAQGNEGLIFQNAADADLTAHVTSNRFTGILGTNVLVGTTALNGTASANLVAVVSGNTLTVGASGGPYPTNRTLIGFPSSTNGQVSISNIIFAGNTINTFSDPANGLAEPLFVSTPDPTSDPSFTASVLNNVVNIDDPGATALRGIAVQSIATVSAGCFDVRGNDVNYTPSAPPGVNGIRVRQAGGGTAQLEQGASAGTAAAVLAANNPLSTTEVLGTVTVVGNNTCLPVVP